ETWRDSRTLFAHAVALEESSVAHTNLGLALEADGELAAAERHHARATELAPALAGPRLNRARVLGALGRRSEAEAELAAAVAAEPDLAEAHAQLGWLLVEEGRDAEALPHLRRAHELAPEHLAIANNLAWVLATSATVADAAAARALAERLVDSSRGQQPAHLETLAAALARLGRFEEAVPWQARALECVPAAARGPLAERLALYRSGRPYVRGR
ncbi:MAG TPA: tetratricopeptide repeat protein, partial [Planctomycetota bacterium]